MWLLDRTPEIKKNSEKMVPIDNCWDPGPFGVLGHSCQEIVRRPRTTGTLSKHRYSLPSHLCHHTPSIALCDLPISTYSTWKFLRVCHFGDPTLPPPPPPVFFLLVSLKIPTDLPFRDPNTPPPPTHTHTHLQEFLDPSLECISELLLTG